MRRFSAAYPHISLEIVIDSSAAMSAKLADGTLDVIVGDASAINAQPQACWTQSLFWVGARGLTLPADLSSQSLPLVTFGGGCLWHGQVVKILKRANIPWRVVCSSTSLPAVQSAVEAGLGITVLLEGNIRSESMRVLGRPMACRRRRSSISPSMSARCRRSRPRQSRPAELSRRRAEYHHAAHGTNDRDRPASPMSARPGTSSEARQRADRCLQQSIT
ncbi:substrate-binding domain-containing protein [Pseudomonas sp. PCH446]